jgi:hypothetical protein
MQFHIPYRTWHLVLVHMYVPSSLGLGLIGLGFDVPYTAAVFRGPDPSVSARLLVLLASVPLPALLVASVHLLAFSSLAFLSLPPFVAAERILFHSHA